MKRTHRCGELTITDEGKKAILQGWVRRTRDLGGLLFVDLRDVSGVIQLNLPAGDAVLYEEGKKLHMEDVIEIEGTVRKRGEKNINPNMKTGQIEIEVKKLAVLNRSEVPPFVIDEADSASEELRFKYRYLDLRREQARDNMILRSKAVMKVRNYFEKNGFIDIETPVLIKSTPEGARDYLVPSRLHHGKFYALPQSPQIFKQILMIAGFDRYIQIPKCYRDEDLRADRQPEFMQIDLEMSFVEQEDIFDLIEGMIVDLWQLIGAKLEIPFRRLTWREAMEKYGSDKPDTRFGFEIQDITEPAMKTGLNIFAESEKKDKTTVALVINGGAGWSRKVLDDMTEKAKKTGAAGLLWIKIDKEGVKSPIVKQIGESKTAELAEAAGAGEGDICLVISDRFETACTVLGVLREEIGTMLELKDDSKFEFLWIYDFPMFEWDEEEKRFTAKHHPFTSPREEDIDHLESDPGSVLSRAYDIVCNGIELGGGSIRIHRADIQRRVFKALGISEQEAERRFGFLLEALRYGAPPHGGIALGMDRICAMLAGEKSIKEVIAFPKTTSAICPMTDSPSTVDDRVLDELGISIKKKT